MDKALLEPLCSPSRWDPELSHFPSLCSAFLIWLKQIISRSFLLQQSCPTCKFQLPGKSVYEEPYIFQRHHIKEETVQFNTTCITSLKKELYYRFLSATTPNSSMVMSFSCPPLLLNFSILLILWHLYFPLCNSVTHGQSPHSIFQLPCQ